jgi:hypothetical protein
MTAFTATNGAVNYFDQYSGGSVNATLDTYAISNQSTITVRTDSNACLNHSVAFGSLDTVTFSGTGGTLNFDPTYTRVIAYTGGSGNSPAFGATITANNGSTAVFLGAWTNWLSECIVPGAAIGATGFIKIGGRSAAFNAGALTGITATCSGADVQGWIEVRGDTIATITVPRIGKVTSTEAWYEIGTTNGSAGQVIACPTCATNANTFPAVWIETGSGTGIYEPYASVGTVVALAAHRTDASMKVITQTTSGIRIGNDGTNNVFFLPVTGCKVRIPAVILTNSTRTVSGTGPRVLPNATIATRQEFVTTGAGYFDLRGIVSQWYMNFSQAFYVKYKSCAISDSMILSEIASPLDVTDCAVGPTQAQINIALAITSCFAGGTVSNNVFNRFSLASASSYVAQLNYVTGVAFSGNKYRSGTLRANATTGVITSTQPVSCTFTNETFIGGRGLFVGAQNCTFTNPSYYDHTITTTTSSTNPMSILEFTTGSNGNVVNGVLVPTVAVGPYTALATISASYNTTVKNIGTDSVTTLALNAAVTGVGVNCTGNNDGVTIKRMYLTNTRTGPYAFVNSDTNIVIENVRGDYADTTVQPGLNAIMKNVGITSATTGQVSTYGTHWITRFTSTTAGFTEILCNEPTSASAAQCSATGGTPQFNSSGSLLLTKALYQVTWEMPFFAIGYTAFTNSAPVITGTNVTFVSGSTWGNHTLEYQIDVGSGWNGSWLGLNAANLITHTINSTTGFKLKVRATTFTAAANNVLTNLRVLMTTTSAAQQTSLYPLTTNTLTLTGLVSGSDVVINTNGTSTTVGEVDAGGTTFAWVFSGAQTIDIKVIKAGYMPYQVYAYSLTAADATLPIAQVADRTYI